MTRVSGHGFKKSGVLRGGFEYQDLVAIEVLIDFLRDASLYDWVQVEAEDSSFQAIEDVVACRKDGKHEVTQVKFTPNPQDSKRRLSWKWLTDHKEQGTSLLQKWSETTLSLKRDGKLAQAMLKTDRIPDCEFLRCLEENRVDYQRLSVDTKKIINDQLGSEQLAIDFFQCFEFVHSMERFENYEELLRAKLERDTDKRGWAYFRQEVRRWAMFKHEPQPEGKIRHFHLINVFTREPSVTLRQDFKVPSSYSIPDNFFHDKFIENISSNEGVTVLWGPPGRGKSTYLSHCVSELANKDEVVCIRHHYFLNLNEQQVHRYSYIAIERSLIQQLKDLGLPGDSQTKAFTEVLKVAASKIHRSGRRLVIIVDGLDHVWRDRADATQMNLLFASLLPIPEGVHLLVGTQRIKDEHLPKILLNKLPKDQWTELPAMSDASVKDWLKWQVANRNLQVRHSRTRTQEEMVDELGSALHDISAGLPLHLIYSLEALLKAGIALTVKAVKQLPKCPSGEIEKYYNTLWLGLSISAKQVLHLLAGLKFGPPSFGLGQCLTGDVNWWQVLNEIGFLLDCREASVVPFHGSLFAFLHSLSEHRQTFCLLAPAVLTWLEEESPEYWRRAWLWVLRADLGDVTDLLKNPTRQWLIDWLISGYPLNQLVYILERAEEAALDKFDLPKLIHLRCLKARAINGPNYQFNEWGLFWETSLRLSEDKNLGSVLWDRLPELEIEELVGVAKLGAGVPSDADRQVIQELNRRYAATTSKKFQAQWDEYSRAVVRIVAHLSNEKADSVIKFAEKSSTEGLIQVYTSTAIMSRNYGHVLEIASRRSNHSLDRDTFAALCLEGIGPSARSSLLAIDRPQFVCLSFLTGEHLTQSIRSVDVSFLWDEERDIGLALDVRDVGHQVFFNSLAAVLTKSPSGLRANFGEKASHGWLGCALRALEQLAGDIGRKWLTADHWPALKNIYQNFRLKLPTALSSRERSFFIGIRLALRDIAIDLCLLGTGILNRAKIDSVDIRTAATSPFWLTEVWLETFYERAVPLHSMEGSLAVLDLVTVELSKRIVMFDERAALMTKVAQFALDHGHLERSRIELRRAADCILGYGYHKDLFVFEVLDSVLLMAKQGCLNAKGTFLSLAKEVEAISEYTDGDETEYARDKFYEGVIELFPEKVSGLYANLIADQDWAYAEDLVKYWLKKISSASLSDRMLLSTLIASTEFHAAWKTAGTLNEGTKVQEQLERMTGRESPLTSNRDTSSSKVKEKSKEMPNPSRFKPGNLSNFVKSARNAQLLPDDNIVSRWLKFWDSKDRHKDALDDYKVVAESRIHRFECTEALDTVFEISRKRDGRSIAFGWLIRAMIENRGWDNWWANDEKFRGRVRTVVRDYPDLWQELVIESSKCEPIGQLEGNGIRVGFFRLVYFLKEVGQSELAERCAMEMVDVFRNEVSSQPLVWPDWAK